jgi:3-oxoacyl-[acyl-carrier protein] reductase
MNPSLAIVCGGAGGLGEAVCLALSAASMTVAIVDIDHHAIGRVADAVRSTGGTAYGFESDISDPDAVVDLRMKVIDNLGPPDILANLAGVTRNAVLWKVTDDDFEAVQKSHVRSTLNTMRSFVPDMRTKHYGRIVNTSSIASLGTRGGSSYSAAKGAIEALSRTASLELARDGITVNCVSPGVVGTGMFARTPEDFQTRMLEKIPLGRPGKSEEVAAVFAFLASREAGYITGQTINVCGGLTVGALD